MTDPVGLCHDVPILLLGCCKLCLCLLGSHLLPSGFLLGMFFRLSLFHEATSFPLLFLLLLSLDHLLFEFVFVFAFRLLLVLHADILQGLES